MNLIYDGKKYPIKINDDIDTEEKETVIGYTKGEIRENGRMRVYSCIKNVVKHLVSIPEFEIVDVNIAEDDEGEYVYGVKGTLPISHLRLKSRSNSKVNTIGYSLI